MEFHRIWKKVLFYTLGMEKSSVLYFGYWVELSFLLIKVYWYIFKSISPLHASIFLFPEA
jgi:hypothetical protein